MFSKLKERLLHWLFHIENNWQVGIVFRDQIHFDDVKLFGKIKWLPNPSMGYYADPFIIEHAEGLDLFVEEYDIRKDKGVITCLRLDKDLKIIEKTCVIEASHHLSFPFLFQYNEKWYLLPESGGAGRLTLFECISYPNVWKEKSVMLDEPVTDPILFSTEQGYFLLYSFLDGTENSDLYYRFSKTPLNFEGTESFLLTKQDSTARNAGAIFKEQDALIRPSQDSKLWYGAGIRLNRLRVGADQTLYEEYWKSLPTPSTHPLGFHTINRSKNFVAIDARKRFYQFKTPLEILRMLKSKTS